MEIKHFLLFSHWGNSISLGDLSTLKISSKIAIPNTESIFDVCIWNNSEFEKESAILACKNQNSIKGLSNFKNVDYSKGTDQLWPINFRKIFIKDKTTGTFKEHLGVLLSDVSGSYRKVMFY